MAFGVSSMDVYRGLFTPPLSCRSSPLRSTACASVHKHSPAPSAHGSLSCVHSALMLRSGRHFPRTLVIFLRVTSLLPQIGVVRSLTARARTGVCLVSLKGLCSSSRLCSRCTSLSRGVSQLWSPSQHVDISRHYCLDQGHLWPSSCSLSLYYYRDGQYALLWQFE